MANTIDVAFIIQFEAEVHLAYQRMGSKLRGTIRTVNGVQGEKVTFQKVGKGVAGRKSRNGNVPIMNPNHEKVEATLEDHYAAEYIDKLDELKIKHDERAIAAKSGAAALGRKTDELITTAMDATTNPNNVTTATTWSTAAAPLAFMEALGEADVPLGDGDAFSVVCWQAWGDLLEIDEFSNADYIGQDDLPFLGAQAKSWAGLVWFPFSGLPTDSNGDKKQFVYHRAAVGHAIGEEITPDVTWSGEKQAHLVVHRMSQVAKLIDETGVIENLYDITP